MIGGHSVLLREALGLTLRHTRAARGLTLRDVAGAARVSVGYLSEVERGRKEVSSEFLAAICSGLGITVAQTLRATADLMAPASPEQVTPAA